MSRSSTAKGCIGRSCLSLERRNPNLALRYTRDLIGERDMSNKSQKWINALSCGCTATERHSHAALPTFIFLALLML